MLRMIFQGGDGGCSLLHQQIIFNKSFFPTDFPDFRFSRSYRTRFIHDKNIEPAEFFKAAGIPDQNTMFCCLTQSYNDCGGCGQAKCARTSDDHDTYGSR